ncbi:MAG: hydroxymethylbilane synthase [Acidimicrobiia bacterium]
MPRPLRVATRASALARWQAERVAALLGGGDAVELVPVTTTGDLDLTTPLHALGGTGVFVKEVQAAVLDGRADLAVHSAKDLPASDTPEGLVLAAVPERGDVRDALVGSTLDALPEGARVATGSVRRRAQLAALRPDLEFAELRGNMATRLEKAADFDAIVVALVALERLGLADRVSDVLDPSVMCPQVGQGALAVECRADDDETLTRLRAIDDVAGHRAVDTERAFLAELGSGCDLPCGAHARLDGDTITIDAVLASIDGTTVLRAGARGADPLTTGRAVADDLLGRGGRALLELPKEAN